MTVRDLFEAGITAAGRPQPENGSPPFQAIVRRQVQSLDFFRVPLRYYDLMAFHPDPPTGLVALLRREPPRVGAVGKEWPAIRAVLDDGHPCPLGLIRVASATPRDLTRNHQVLAYGYDAADDGSRFAIRIYDPNHRVSTRGAPGGDRPRRRPAAARPGAAAPDDRGAAARVLRPALPAAVGGPRLALGRAAPALGR